MKVQALGSHGEWAGWSVMIYPEKFAGLCAEFAIRTWLGAVETQTGVENPAQEAGQGFQGCWPLTEGP